MKTSRRSTDSQSSILTSEAAAGAETRSCRRSTAFLVAGAALRFLPLPGYLPTQNRWRAGFSAGSFPGNSGRLVVRGAERAPARGLRREAQAVLRPGAAGPRRPADLREPGQARKGHVLDVAQVVERLAPEGRLDAEHVLLAHARDERGRIPGVRVAGAVVAGPGEAERRVGVVLLVEVRPRGGLHHELHPLLHRVARALGAVAAAGGRVPVLAPRRRAEARGLQARHPADERLAVRRDDRLRLPQERRVVGWARRLRLVAADVEPLPGRDRGELADDVVVEPVGHRLGDAERAEADVRRRVELRRLAVAVELRVGGERGVHVAGRVDLRDDGDVARRRVRDDLLVLRLGVVAALPAADLGRAADGREPRPRGDGD